MRLSPLHFVRSRLEHFLQQVHLVQHSVVQHLRDALLEHFQHRTRVIPDKFDNIGRCLNEPAQHAAQVDPEDDCYNQEVADVDVVEDDHAADDEREGLENVVDVVVDDFVQSSDVVREFEVDVGSGVVVVEL